MTPTIRAFDRDLRHEQFLGEAPLGPDGAYEICYDRAQFRRAEKKSADLIVRVVDCEGKVLAESPILFNAPAEATIDLAVPDTSPELEQLVAAIKPVLDGVTIADLTDDDLTFLVGETAVARDRLALLVAAARLASAPHVSAEVLYALFREGMPTDVGLLGARSDDDLHAALDAAVEQNIVRPGLTKVADATFAALHKLAVSSVLAPSGDPKTASVGALLDAAGIAKDVQTTLVTMYTAEEGSIEEFWTALAARTDLPPGTAEAAQNALWIGALSRNHMPLVNALVAQKRAPRDLAAFTQAQWLDLVKEPSVGFPADTAGEGDAEKASNYAASLAASVERAFPTAVFVERLAAAKRENDTGVVTYLRANPDLDLTVPIERYFQKFPDRAPPADVEPRVRAYARLMKLTPRFEHVDKLVQDGLSSATAIVAVGRPAFVARYAETFGSADDARATFISAEQVSAAALALFARFSPQFNAVKTRVTP